MIFCLTTGRSGTAYLAHMLNLCRGVHAVHEPLPDFATATRPALQGRAAANHFWMVRKIPAIDLICPRGIYIETNHGFKYLADAFLELGFKADVIVLRRPARDVALSYWRKGSIPGRTEDGLRYFAKPDDPLTRLPMSDWQDLTDYQLCYWYCLETEHRIAWQAERFEARGLRVAETTLASVTTPEGFLRLLSRLALPRPDWQQYRLENRPMNQLPLNRYSEMPEGSLSAQELVIERLAQEVLSE